MKDFRNCNNRTRRSYFEIIADILKLCRIKANKTRILYQVNLNYILLQKYLNLLMDKGLLEVDEDRRKWYTTTDKGEDFLVLFNKIYFSIM